MTPLNDSSTFLIIVVCIQLLVTDCQWFVNGSHFNRNEAETNFKRLDWSDGSEDVVNQCCKREPKFVTVADGIGNKKLQLDIGECRMTCELSKKKPLKREEFEKYLKKYPHLNPIQLFLRLQNGRPLSTEDESDTNESSFEELSTFRSKSSCLSSTCLPTGIRQEMIFSFSGSHALHTVIEACDCVTLPQRCQRMSFPVTFNVGTPYQKVVDVGRCLGSCGRSHGDDAGENDHELNCKIVRNRTESIEGPNGAQCVPVIDECECVSECYRVGEFFSVLDYQSVFDEGLEPEDKMPVKKTIDIGRCEGTCKHKPPASKCVLWSNSTIKTSLSQEEDNNSCLSWLYGGQSKCTGTNFVSHGYTDQIGKKHSIVSISGCGCR